MESLILNEMGAMMTGLSMLVTFIGVPSFVDFQMNHCLRGLSKCLIIFITFLEALASMDLLIQVLIETLTHSPHLQMLCMFLQTSLFGRTIE